MEKKKYREISGSFWMRFFDSVTKNSGSSDALCRPAGVGEHRGSVRRCTAIHGENKTVQKYTS